jgi:hypothetical protein
MLYDNLFVIKDEIMKVAESENLDADLSREVERVVAGIDDGKTAASYKREIIKLISSIEKTKVRFLRGEVRAKDLHRETDLSLRQFHQRHHHFNYRNNPIFTAFYFLPAHKRSP